MNNCTQYDEILEQYMSFIIGVGIFVAIVVLGLFFSCIATKNKKTAILTLVSGVLIVSIMYIFFIYPYQKDIDENAYITYTGEFYVEECYSVNRGGAYIKLKHGASDTPIRYKALCDISFVKNNTQYVGKFVYSKNSKCLIDIQLMD